MKFFLTLFVVIAASVNLCLSQSLVEIPREQHPDETNTLKKVKIEQKLAKAFKTVKGYSEFCESKNETSISILLF
jgi:hypothetical protein